MYTLCTEEWSTFRRSQCIDFDQRDGWDRGPVVPDDPTEEYPVGDGTRQKSLSEAIRDGAAGVIEGAQATLGDTYDLTEAF
jgi:hypothetical protein